ncbi:Dienelactone hydrolase [Macrophomina phaseolina MS6]|uniref:Dienelactone hydrolase n=1 Tax=Macrophomina phaseolina (strain MS6) TaxID=1126212 RepID=K2RYZ6_MACPH|nr:Dienelactone hydrolase [Macrophomina phaseolina MS6]
MASECCLKGSKWEGTPVGTEDKISNYNTYITGSNPDVAILVVHDAFGWTFNNSRLLADQYAQAADATVYIPDFFDGEVIPPEVLKEPNILKTFDFEGFNRRHSKEIRLPQITEVAKALRSRYKRLGAVGFCFGGWAVFRLGAKDQNRLVDCITVGHPTALEKGEIENVGVPVQIIAPEHDPTFTPELKAHSFNTIQALGLPFDYQYFPGLEHAFCTRGNPGDLHGMERAKNAAILWFQEWLHEKK